MKEHKPEDKVCYNCKHLLWMVGIGQGLKCGHPARATASGLPKIIPHSGFSCSKFQFKEKSKKSS